MRFGDQRLEHHGGARARAAAEEQLRQILGAERAALLLHDLPQQRQVEFGRNRTFSSSNAAIRAAGSPSSSARAALWRIMTNSRAMVRSCPAGRESPVYRPARAPRSRDGARRGRDTRSTSPYILLLNSPVSLS